MPAATFQRADRHSIFAKHYQRVPGEGPKNAKIMLIGERPGEEEAIRGRPFVGPTGELLNVLLTVANLDRKQIYITNLVKTFDNYRKPTDEEVGRDWAELLAEIGEVKPAIVGLMGTFAVEHILRREPGGRAELDRTHGVPVQLPNSSTVWLPMFHPAAGLHTPEVMAKVLDDFLRLAQLADGEITVREDEYAGREEYRAWPSQGVPVLNRIIVPTYSIPCAIDTEGTRKHPWCLTVSTRPGKADLFKSPIAPSSKVYLHNSLHDLGVLRTMGVELAEGQFVDTMVLAYQLCIEPQGLKALAYRHCGMEMDDYADLVREPGKLKAEAFFHELGSREWPNPDPYMVLDKGMPKVKKPWNISRLVGRALTDLASGKLDKDGNPPDLRARWENWDDEVKAPVVEVLGEMPEATLDDVEPAVAENYACRDADATLRIGPILEAKVEAMGLGPAVKVDHDILPMVDRMQTVGIQLAPIEFWDGIERQCEAQMGRSKYQVYKMTGAEINPASGDQVAELLYGQLGLRPPKMTDGGGRGSVNATCLEQLLGEAPVVEPIMDYTEAQKIRGTYVRPLRKLAATGERAHSTFRVTRTTTGRLSMADPPLHQIPILSDLGKQCRAGFVAPDGRLLGDWDFDQIEMRLMAHDSQDRELCRLFNEGRDIHRETAAAIFGCSTHDIVSKGDLRRQVAKHAAFGIINGITEHGMVNYMILNRCRRPDGGAWTTDDCVTFIAEWFKLYHGVKIFHNNCIAETQATGLARESISGRIVYLPAVWSPNKRIRETAERMSYVMHTQGGAASLIKRSMKAVWDNVCKNRELDTDPLLWVHDELLMECPDDPRICEIDHLMVESMRTTTTLRVPVLVSGGYGRNWLQAH